MSNFNKNRIRFMRKLILTALVTTLGVILLAGCNNSRATLPDEQISVRIMQLTKETASKTVTASGHFTTEDETYLSFKTGGVVKGIFVKEGDPVSKGQLLATLDMTEIEASVSQAKAAYDKALRDFNRINNLYKDSVATLSQYQDAKTALDVAVELLNIANYNLSYSEIRSVQDGFVLKKMVNPGQMVNPGMPILQTNGAGRGNWILRISVSDNEWTAIKLNDRALVQVEAISKDELQAIVYKKSEGLDPISGTFSIDLKLLSKPVSELASGLFGSAKIMLSQQATSWAIPYESLLDGDKNTGYVFVTNDYVTVHKVKVTISDIMEDKVLISSGLEDSKALVTSGSAYLNDNSKIKIENPN